MSKQKHQILKTKDRKRLRQNKNSRRERERPHCRMASFSHRCSQNSVLVDLTVTARRRGCSLTATLFLARWDLTHTQRQRATGLGFTSRLCALRLGTRIYSDICESCTCRTARSPGGTLAVSRCHSCNSPSGGATAVPLNISDTAVFKNAFKS